MGHGNLRRPCFPLSWVTLGIPSLPHGPWRDYKRVSEFPQIQESGPPPAFHPREFPAKLDRCSGPTAASHVLAVQTTLRAGRSAFCDAEAQVSGQGSRISGRNGDADGPACSCTLRSIELAEPSRCESRWTAASLRSQDCFFCTLLGSLLPFCLDMRTGFLVVFTF